MGGLEWWHWVLIGCAFVLLFGYKKLPSATKSIAQSMKIFRDETKGLRGGDDHDETAAASALPTQHPQHDNAGALAAPDLTAVTPQPIVAQPVAQPVTQPVVQPVPAAQPVTVPAPPAPLAPGSLAPRPGEYAGKRPAS